MREDLLKNIPHPPSKNVALVFNMIMSQAESMVKQSFSLPVTVADRLNSQVHLAVSQIAEFWVHLNRIYAEIEQIKKQLDDRKEIQ